MHLQILAFISLFFLSTSFAVRLKTKFAPQHFIHSPSDIYQSPCNIPEPWRTCSLKTTKKSSWSGIKLKTETSKFVFLDPTPVGHFDFARRVCEACDLELAEIWDEDDLSQFLEGVSGPGGENVAKNVTKNETSPSSYWIGAFLNKKQRSKRLRWTYQDGKTFLGFKEGIEGEEPDDETKRACLTLSKSGNFSSWKIGSCDSSHSVLCQYKAKYNCYKESKGEVRLSPMSKVGYYFSSKALSWNTALHSCGALPQKPLSLLYVSKNSKDQGSLAGVVYDYLQTHHHMPKSTDLWTSAKFHGDKLYWNLNGQLIEMEEWTGLPWGNEQEDIKGKDCVYMRAEEKKGVTLYHGDCEAEKFFVCRTSEIEGPSIKYCNANGTQIQRSARDCKWNWLFDKKPECICYEGVHGLTSHTTCNTRLLVGPRCIKLSPDKKAILHWKAIREIDNVDKPFLLLQNRNRRGNKFIQWIHLRPGAKRQMFGDANVYFRGLTLFQKPDNGQVSYCFEPEEGSDGGSYYEAKLRNESFWISYNKKKKGCGGQKDAVRIRKRSIDGPDECQLKCKSANTSKPIADLIVRPDQSPKTIGGSESSQNLNTELLKHVVDSMFGFNSNETEKQLRKINQEPKLRLLEKLFDITKNICSCMVPSFFFENALELFKLAYAAGSYEHVDDFGSASELDRIDRMLRLCLENSVDKAVVCERNECNGRAIKTTELTTDTSLKTTPVDDTGYAIHMHHHLMEIVWNAIEIWNVGCIREFKESYLLYHALEQAMERLFVGDIKKLWHNPRVVPNYYKHLLGPAEAVHISNLKNCVKAVYEANPKVLKLARPRSPPPDLLGKQIRSRKRNEEFLHDRLSKSIFCSKDQFCLD